MEEMEWTEETDPDQPEPQPAEARRLETAGDGRRLDVQLSELSGLTRSRIASLMEEGNVTVDGAV